MYVWIWRHLPGNVVAKVFGSLLVFAGACALLFLVVFPWIEPRLPFNDVTVNTPHAHSSPASPSPR
ncbi:MAG: hypothetical protein JO222_10760 [Frankiales bacterium]|nr:hypothetical protein [Frankiales bacterium]